MTIPTTHPLYGATSALRESEMTQAEAVAMIRTLERAGYRVVGPEPTEAMLKAAYGFEYTRNADRWAPYIFRQALSGAIAAAPTITETETGK
jgi:hypothetical protein